MMLPRQSTRAIITALFLSIATTALLQFVNKNEQAIAGDKQTQLAQDRSPVFNETVEENYVTRLFDLSGKELAQFAGWLDRFSPDGQRLLLSSSNSALSYLFDVSGTKLLQFGVDIAQFGPDAQRAVQFSPDGQRVVITFDRRTYLYDTMGQKLAQFPGNFALPIFSPDGQQFLIFADDSAYLVDISGRQIAQMQGQFLDVRGGFDSTGQRFILYRRDDPTTCDLFDSTGQTIARLRGECAWVSPDGRRFVVSTGTLDEPSFQLYDFSGQNIAQLSADSPTFSSDGQLILTSDFHTGTSSYLQTSSGQEIAQLQGTNGRFSPTGQRLATTSNKIVHLYNSSGNEIAQLPGDRVAFLPRSDKFVTYSFGENQLYISRGETRLFDSSGQELALLMGYPSLDAIIVSGDSSLSRTNPFLEDSFSFFSPDGQRLVTTDAQNSYLYNASGEQIAELQGAFLSFSLTGQHFVTRSEGKVHLFDRSGIQLMEVEGEFASFSPDGQRLAITVQNTP